MSGEGGEADSEVKNIVIRFRRRVKTCPGAAAPPNSPCQFLRHPNPTPNEHSNFKEGGGGLSSDPVGEAAVDPNHAAALISPLLVAVFVVVVVGCLGIGWEVMVVG